MREGGILHGAMCPAERKSGREEGRRSAEHRVGGGGRLGRPCQRGLPRGPAGSVSRPPAGWEGGCLPRRAAAQQQAAPAPAQELGSVQTGQHRPPPGGRRSGSGRRGQGPWARSGEHEREEGPRGQRGRRRGAWQARGGGLDTRVLMGTQRSLGRPQGLRTNQRRRAEKGRGRPEPRGRAAGAEGEGAAQGLGGGTRAWGGKGGGRERARQKGRLEANLQYHKQG